MGMRVLAGDVGGTNTRFLLAEVDGDRVTPLWERQVLSSDFPDLTAAARSALADEFPDGFQGSGAPERACFAVAGPVHGGRTRITNLPWQLEQGELARALGLKSVELINDFTGVGEGLAALTADQWQELLPGEPESGGPCAYLGAGTGLGQGWRIPCGDGMVVVASEGGHAGFAPRTEREARLLSYWQGRLGRVHREVLLSGPGIARIAEYLREVEGMSAGPALSAALADGGDPAAALGSAGIAGRDPLAVETLRLFVGIYGAVAGDAGLEVVATGGVWLAGGIAPRLAELLHGREFREAFLDKGPMSHVAQRLPVRLVTEPRVGLLGAARRAALSAD